jgi:4-alpha-glucanotransferase
MSKSALDELSEEAGLTLHYRDALGQDRIVPDDTKRHMLEALGLSAATDAEARDRLRVLRQERAERLCPRTVVFTEDEPRIIPVRRTGRLKWRLLAEDGREFAGEAHTDELPQDTDGARLLPLPADFTLGYHTLTMDCGDANLQRRVIVAPRSCYLPPSGERLWGVALQLYSLPSPKGWGAGSYGDLPDFVRAAAAQGAHFVGLNPLHALFPAEPGHFGPYSPSSRAFLNTFYIDPAAVPGSKVSPPHVEASELVDYRAVDALKRPALEALWGEFSKSGGDAAFARFETEGGESLRRHALFEALHEHFLKKDRALWSWRDWPADFRRPESRGVAAFAAANEDRVHFFAWLQFLADTQIRDAAHAARDAGMEIGLYQDLAVGVDPSGAAAWADQDMIRATVSVGAPPDQLNPKGQNWGIAPYDPEALTDAGFEPFAQDVRAVMRHAGAMRLDHVMALQRLFWIPRGADATEGVYIRYPRDALLSIVALESQRRRCAVIGEDLGTVPEGFGEAMRARDVFTYKVLYFERGADGEPKAPWDYPREALATVTTHDLPTLRGAFADRDLDLMHGLGLYPSEAVEQAIRDDRARLTQSLRRVFVQGGLLDEGDEDLDALAAAAYGYLARTPALLLAVAAEDLAGMGEQPNLPGTVEEHPNWRRRLPMDAQALFASPTARRIIEAIRRERVAP